MALAATRNPVSEYFVLAVAGGMVGAGLGPRILSSLGVEVSPTHAATLCTAAILLPGFALLSFLRYRKNFSPDSELPFGHLTADMDVLTLGAIASVCAILLALLTIYFWTKAGWVESPHINRDVGDSPFIAVSIAIASCLVYPIVEEILFRGVLFARLQEFVGGVALVCVCSIAFVAYHTSLFGDVLGQVQIMILGLVTGLMRLRTGGLVAPILVHAGYNSAPLFMQF